MLLFHIIVLVEKIKTDLPKTIIISGDQWLIWEINHFYNKISLKCNFINFAAAEADLSVQICYTQDILYIILLRTDHEA